MDTATKEKNIIWKPNPGPQTYVLTKTEDEILFGGARGGGKTDAGIVWVGDYSDNPKYRGLVIRRNSDDLLDWTNRAKDIFKRMGAVKIGREFRFPSGAIILTGHLADDNAYERYQGHEYQKMLLEELTHIPSEELYEKLIGSCRSTITELKPQILCTTNPGGPGHRWVKKRFIDVQPLVDHTYVDAKGKHKMFRAGKKHVFSVKLPDRTLSMSRVFVQALVEDNPYIYDKDPRYVAYLYSLPDDLKAMWLEGQWEVGLVKGAYYTPQLQKARVENRITRVPVDPTIPVEVYMDIGIGDATSVGFVQHAGLEHRFVHHYVNEGEGLTHYLKYIENWAKDHDVKVGDYYAPHDFRNREFTSGKSRYEVAKKMGYRFKIVEKAKIEDGIEAARDIFPFVLFDNEHCEYLVDALTTYRKKWNAKLGEFGDKPEHDWSSHPADMFRYFAWVNRVHHVGMADRIKKEKHQLQTQDEPFDKYKLFR